MVGLVWNTPRNVAAPTKGLKGGPLPAARGGNAGDDVATATLVLRQQALTALQAGYRLCGLGRG